MTPLVECSCVVRSGTGELPGGEALVPGGAETRAALPAEVHVSALPEEVPLSATS